MVVQHITALVLRQVGLFGSDGFRVAMGQYTEKSNRCWMFWKTESDSNVGIWQTENNEKSTEADILMFMNLPQLHLSTINAN